MPLEMKLSSPVFGHNGLIPKKYTCQGEDINPPLKIENVPQNTHSLVLIVEDPDVPKHLRPDGMYDHWVVYDISPYIKEIQEDSSPFGKMGKNSAGENKYKGPCPPDRQHRYFFKLFALNRTLNLAEGISKNELIKNMQGAIIATAEIIGLYEKT